MKVSLQEFQQMFMAGKLNPENSPAIEQLRRDMIEREVSNRVVKLDEEYGVKFTMQTNEKK